MPDRLTPARLVDERDLTLVDIRLPEERELLGWIPGSLHWPDPPAGKLDAIDGRVVLTCATGRRTQELMEQCRSGRVTDLEGGLLAWSSAQLPVCRMPQPAEGGPYTPDAFRRQIRSCFIVESVESGNTIEADDQRALEMVQELFADLEHLDLSGVLARIDQLAHQARRSGHRLDFIAQHVQDFYALAPLLFEEQP